MLSFYLEKCCYFELVQTIIHLFISKLSHFIKFKHNHGNIKDRIAAHTPIFDGKKTHKLGRCFHFISTEISKAENVIYIHLKYVMCFCLFFNFSIMYHMVQFYSLVGRENKPTRLCSKKKRSLSK